MQAFAGHHHSLAPRFSSDVQIMVAAFRIADQVTATDPFCSLVTEKQAGSSAYWSRAWIAVAGPVRRRNSPLALRRMQDW
jgi:hypothetical protein